MRLRCRPSSVRSLTRTRRIGDVTAALNAQQLADIAAVEAKLVLTPNAGNNNNGSSDLYL